MTKERLFRIVDTAVGALSPYDHPRVLAERPGSSIQWDRLSHILESSHWIPCNSGATCHTRV